jgi:hypothetical protein
MDAQGFDAWLRSLAAVHSRRRAFKAVLIGSLGLLGVTHDDVAAGKCGEKVRICTRTPHGDKRCKVRWDYGCCPECQTFKKGQTFNKSKCRAKDNGTACTVGTCQGGVCTAPAG